MTAEILIVNVHSSSNAGDAALTQVTLEELRQHFPHSRITLAMDDPQSHTGSGRAIGSFFTWVRGGGSADRPGWRLRNLFWLVPGTLFPALTYRLTGKAILALTPPGWRDLVSAYEQADFVASKPGGFLYSSGRSVTLLVSLYILALAHFFGKPVYILPQSIGPLNHAWECRVLRWVLQKARLVMVREPVSFEQVRLCGVEAGRVSLIPDMAFAFSAAPPPAAEEWLVAQHIPLSQPLLGMTTINWGAQNPRFKLQENYEAACTAAARAFIRMTGGKVLLFPQVWGPLASQDDRVPAARIAEALCDLEHSVFLIRDPLPPDLLKAVYGHLDLFIGTRMHSNIFALSQGVPVIAIGYQHKTQGIARMAGLEQWVIDIQEINPQALVEKMTQLWEERQTWREHIRQTIPGLTRQVKEATRRVADDFAQWKGA